MWGEWDLSSNSALSPSSTVQKDISMWFKGALFKKTEIPQCKKIQRGRLAQQTGLYVRETLVWILLCTGPYPYFLIWEMELVGHWRFVEWSFATQDVGKRPPALAPDGSCLEMQNLGWAFYPRTTESESAFIKGPYLHVSYTNKSLKSPNID